MKKLLLVLPILLWAHSAKAVVDPRPSKMGIYFDEEANVYDTTALTYVILPAYVILINSDLQEISGYEFGYEFSGNCLVAATELRGDEPVDVSQYAQCHMVVLATPMPVTPATVLCRLDLFPLDREENLLTLTGATPSSGGVYEWPAVVAESEVIPIEPTCWDTILEEPCVCATINFAWMYDPVDPFSWDDVKSFYR